MSVTVRHARPGYGAAIAEVWLSAAAPDWLIPGPSRPPGRNGDRRV